ncbi:MAG: hypothetical protein R3322_00130 [Kiloniellales bacterium]|nr:hypothetical protein [Kiloniellales bacterium]
MKKLALAAACAALVAAWTAQRSEAEIIEIWGSHQCPISHYWDGWNCTYGPWWDGSGGDDPPIDPGTGGCGGVCGGDGDGDGDGGGDDDDDPPEDECETCHSVYDNCMAAADAQQDACELHGRQRANMKCNLGVGGPPGYEASHTFGVGGRSIADLISGAATIPGFQPSDFEYECFSGPIETGEDGRPGRPVRICAFNNADSCPATYRQDIPSLTEHVEETFQGSLNVSGIGSQGGVKRRIDVSWGGKTGWASQCAGLGDKFADMCHERRFECTSTNGCYSVIF